MSIALFASAVATSYLSSQFVSACAAITLPECKLPDCEDIIYEKLHPREAKLLNKFTPSLYEKHFGGRQQHFAVFDGNPEYLRFRKDDPKDKFLFLSSYDKSNDEFLDSTNILTTLKEINDRYDLKYKVIKSYEEICQEVNLASKIGKLSNVAIMATGNQQAICLSNCAGQDESIRADRDYFNCFKALDPNGKITLLSAGSGWEVDGNPYNNIAQKIATIAKRMVLAPTEGFSIKSLKVCGSNDFEIFQQPINIINFYKKMFGFLNVDSNNNIFKIFKPIYKDCVNIFKDKIHAREQVAINIVKKATDSKSILIQPDEFDDMQDLLRFCKDDPKQKFLYLSMESNKKEEEALHPRFYPQILEPLSKEYDLKFKVVKSYDELCNEVKEAAKMGDLLNIVINGHGNPALIHIAGEEIDKNDNIIDENFIHMRRNLAKCFQGVDLSKITLFSCSTAAPFNGNPKNNIAHKIADATKGAVVAPKESVFPTKIKLTSINPFEIYHPSECDKYGNCKSNVDTFQTIESKKKP